MEGLPQWGSLSKGDIISFVGRSVILNNGGDHLFRPLECSAPNVIVRGELTMGVENFTFLGIEVLQVTPTVICGIGVDTKVWPCPPCQVSDINKVVELCSGIGIFSTVSTLMGFRVVAGVDENNSWRDMFLKGHADGAVFIHGDCGDHRTVDEICKVGGMHCTLLSGISCQPHSTGGDMRGMDDSRSDSLPKSLSTGWLLQSPIILLECVTGVLQNKQFQQMLVEFCATAGYCVTQSIVHLSNAWCTRRDRWFACLTARILGQIHIPDLPSLTQYATIENVLPQIPRWPRSDLDQIELSLYELMKFADYAPGGITATYLDAKAPFPTTLHSAGNQLYPCRCGCRAALSIQRLQKRGLYGVLIPIGTFVTHENQRWENCRYPHPQELFFLNGGIPSFDFHPDLRLGMAGVGQCVSPIQGIWIFSHIRVHLAKFLQQCWVDPNNVLADYLQALFQARDALWPSTVVKPPEVAETKPMPLQQDANQDFRVPDSNGVDVIFRASPHVTLGEFRKAEEKLHNIQWPIEKLAQEWNENFSDQVVIDSIPFPLPKHSSQACEFPVCNEDKGDNAIDIEVRPVVESADPIIVTPTVPFTVQEQSEQNSAELLSLSADDLLGLPPPSVTSIQVLQTLHTQQISKNHREQILEQQLGTWGDDEIAFFLKDICEHSPPDQHVVWWDPILLSNVVNMGKFDLLRQMAAALPDVATVVTAVVVEKHWNPLVWRIDESGVFAFTCGLVHAYSLAHQALHNAFCQSRGVETNRVHNKCLPFVVNDHCGAMAVAYLYHLVFGSKMPTTREELVHTHDQFRQQFVDNLAANVVKPFLWGKGNDDWKGRLGAILQEHGVASQDVEDRIHYLCEKIGLKEINKVMAAPQPWRELKWIANQKVPMVQVIRPSELQAVLDQKMKEGKPIETRSQKAKSKGAGKGKGKAAELDPLKLRLEQGVFTCGNPSIPLSQIDLSQVGAKANGVVLCTASMALPYLKASRQISAGGLALIVIASAEAIPQTNLISEKVRIPVLCTINAEPLLVDGHMFQLGALPVCRHVQDDRFKLVSISSGVVKVTIYRDQVDAAWTDITQHPLKYIFSKVPILRACLDEECGGNCESWHGTALCNVKEPVLEVWGRQWMQHNFQTSQPDQAQIFAVHFRVPSAIQLQIQAYSGYAGVFAEPKSIDGRGPSDQYQVVWMPKADLPELILLKQTQPNVCGLARVGNRLGLRCKVEHAASLHGAIKPGSAFLPLGRKQTYLVGPVPYGTLKDSLSKALAESGWTARPVQAVPASKQIDGVLWRVQSIENPPTNVLQLDHGEVLISRLDDPQVLSSNNPVVLRAVKTVQLCSNAPQSVDPLQINDPWANNRAFPTIIPSGLKGANDPLVALENRVIESVLSQLPAKPEAMEVDDGHSGRMDVLERRVQELSDGQNQLHSMLQEQGSSHGSQLQELRNQTGRLEVAVGDQASQMTLFQSQFRAQLEQQQGQLDSLFQQQMSRIEEILKKPRRE